VSRTIDREITGNDRRVWPQEVRRSGWSKLFGLPAAAPLRLHVDVGFGDGKFLTELARRDPGRAVVGVDLSFIRVLKLARRLSRFDLRNVRLLGVDAAWAVREAFEDASVESFWINFPDPWPKRRHRHRRLVEPAFVGELARRLMVGGSLHVATDHSDYAAAIQSALEGEPLLENAGDRVSARVGRAAPPVLLLPVSTREDHRGQPVGLALPGRLVVRGPSAYSLPSMPDRPNLKNYSLERLRERFVGEGLPAYRADQVAGWIYQRGVEDFSEMSDLDRVLRERLHADWQSRCLEVDRLDRSTDGTLKAILFAADGAQVESVLIPEADRTTLCVSTQVGCALACTFCATGALGFTRNLTTAEIVEQVCRMREFVDAPRKITNIVFMGMGEPLLNLAAVSRC